MCYIKPNIRQDANTWVHDADDYCYFGYCNAAAVEEWGLAELYGEAAAEVKRLGDQLFGR